jgi:undecaprenyl-phosphate 4-deoxy-4-formamido-L-arabinose transferase
MLIYDVNKAPYISVVIPVYKAEGFLHELYERLRAVLEDITPEFEIIMVEDCGGDRSWEIIQELSGQDKRVKGMQLSRNFGQHAALLCGIRRAKYEVTVTLDDDLQHPPEEIPKLLEKLSQGYDVVYGTPQQERHGLGRDIASQITKIALRSVMNIEIARKVCAFRAFYTHIRKAFRDFMSPFVSIDVLLSWGTTRFGSVAVRHEPRLAGVSGYTFRKLFKHALNMMTGFSSLPLRLATVIGFGFTLFGMGVLAFVLGRYLIYGSAVRGFPFLASIIAIFSGAQLFTLGIIGEYLGHVHFRTMEKPTYVVRAITEGDTEED